MMRSFFLGDQKHEDEKRGMMRRKQEPVRYLGLRDPGSLSGSYTCAVIVESGEEVNELGPVLEEDVDNRVWLVGVGDKHLRHKNGVSK